MAIKRIWRKNTGINEGVNLILAEFLMPFSIASQPEENEIECARCGAYFDYELTRCPECGVNIYEPDEEYEIETKQNKFLSGIKNLFRKIFKKPYSAEEIFGDSLTQANLYANLLRKVGGDENVLERLVNLEKENLPNGNRKLWLKNAISRWERDNRTHKG